MTDHLPECFASLCECDDTHFKSTDCDFSCICPSLRACEQRVLDAAREAVAAKAMHSPKCFALLPDFDEHDCNCAVAYSLAAIDALLEEQK